tara:strand:+ start:211 stop:654 length:444 start_codon:yes stop_codon:yes gene_type:complete
VILCPCKLFKYYEDGKMFYFCEDTATNIEYRIEEFKHKDGIDIILNTVSQNIYTEKKHPFDPRIELDKQKALDDYLKVNPNGINVDFMNGRAIIVIGEYERKIFFSDEKFIVSYEIKVTGKNSDSINSFFNKSINSLALKDINHILK